MFTLTEKLGCLLSPTLFNIILEQIMNDALENHIGTVNIGDKIIISGN